MNELSVRACLLKCILFTGERAHKRIITLIQSLEVIACLGQGFLYYRNSGEACFGLSFFQKLAYTTIFQVRLIAVMNTLFQVIRIYGWLRKRTVFLIVELHPLSFLCCFPFLLSRSSWRLQNEPPLLRAVFLFWITISTPLAFFLE